MLRSHAERHSRGISPASRRSNRCWRCSRLRPLRVGSRSRRREYYEAGANRDRSEKPRHPRSALAFCTRHLAIPIRWKKKIGLTQKVVFRLPKHDPCWTSPGVTDGDRDRGGEGLYAESVIGEVSAKKAKDRRLIRGSVWKGGRVWRSGAKVPIGWSSDGPLFELSII